MDLFYKKRINKITITILFSLLTISCFSFSKLKRENVVSATVVDTLKDLPEYSLPLTNKKLVIAHCMTNIIRFQGHPFEDGCNPKYYPPTGNISASFGGYTQVKPMEDSFLANASLDKAVEFEMRAAIRSGIDGFQFYYPMGDPGVDKIIEAYFKVADEKNINFKFTFCISPPSGVETEDQKIAQYAERINNIFDSVGRNNVHWLRTPDGRLIIYLWYGKFLADIPTDTHGLPDAFYFAQAYRKLAEAVHDRFACVFLINNDITKTNLDTLLDYFPATWIWTLPYPYPGQTYIGDMVAQECKLRNRTFTGSAFCDFYTSKMLKKGTWQIYDVQQVLDAGVNSVERKRVITGLSYNFRKLWEFGIKKNVPIMNIITWNDYPEGHHLAPEINHNAGFSILLKYYKNLWEGLQSPYANRDVAIAFFKKYRHDIVPSPYDIPIVSFQKEVIPISSEDSIQVVTILKSSGELSVDGGSPVNVGPGLQVTDFPMQTGPVTVTVTRNNVPVVHFVTPEGITDKPFRTDRLTYTFSSEFSNFYKNIMPGFVPSFSHQYNPDFNKEMYLGTANHAATDVRSAKVFPNPASRQIQLKLLMKVKENVSITLCDSMGRTILKRKCACEALQTNYQRFDVTDYSNGWYFLNILSKDGKISVPFVIKHS